MSDKPRDSNAEWLRRLANDLRTAGDVGLVHLTDDGIAPAGITLADELWLIAFSIDGISNVEEPKDGGSPQNHLSRLTGCLLAALAHLSGPDPLDTATQWLNLHSYCDIECKQNHPVNHSTVSGLHAAAATARIAAAEYKRERDELQVLLIDAVAQLRALAGRSPVPPAGALRLLASRLEEEL